MPISRNRKKHKVQAAKRAKLNQGLKNGMKEQFLKWAAQQEILAMKPEVPPTVEEYFPEGEIVEETFAEVVE